MIQRGLALARGIKGRVLRAKDRMKQKIRQSRFIASIRPSDVFIVTYPKSGTTWLSFLIAHFLKPEDAELTLKNLYDYVPGIVIESLENDPIQQFGSLPDPRIFANHSVYTPGFPRVIYVLRDPRDVLLSCWHGHRLLIKDFNLSLKEYLLLENHWPCSWAQHVEDWIFKYKHPRLLLIRFEDAKRNTPKVLKQVLDFIGLDHDDHRIEKAVQASSFDRMRSLEENSGMMIPVNGARDERFMRRGKVEGWRDELDPESLAIIEQKCGLVMRMVDYETTTQAREGPPPKNLSVF